LGCVDRSVEREPVRRPRRPGLDLNDYLAVALVLLAGFLRFRELTAQSLWLDECLTVHVVRLADFRDVLAWLAIWSDLGPFHSILDVATPAIRRRGTYSRVPVALAGTLTVAGV
jgi:hypothetical protein